MSATWRSVTDFSSLRSFSACSTAAFVSSFVTNAVMVFLKMAGSYVWLSNVR